MNQLLQDAFNRAADLPPEAQDRFARFLLAELEAGEQWTNYSTGRHRLSC